ncbi:MAG TPA: DUF2207 domain-containing protein [Terriglobales bacterium]|nr:DUF2207 domain-containing protein [Terriglobales bacterium]
MTQPPALCSPPRGQLALSPETLKRPRALTIGLQILVVIFLLAAQGFARDWRIADFRTVTSIGQDGTALIQERITLSFIGSFQGIHRNIPTEYPGPRGTNYTLFLKVLNVTDGAGNKLKYEQKRKGAYLDLKIYIPGASDTTKTVEIAYESPNAVRYFDNHDEFYWNVTGNDWPVPIDHASAVVMLPASAAGGLRAQAFTGVYGSHDQEVTAEVKGSEAVFETTNPLPMRGGMTVDVFIPKGVLAQPGPFTRLSWFLRSNSIIFLPVFALVVMFALWWFKGKDPHTGLSVAPMYEPPQGMSPAEVGTLVDDRIDPRDITSTVIDLAVRGYLRIEQVEERTFIFSSKDYVLHLLKSRDQWIDAVPHERVVLENMFGGGQTCRLSSLKNRFYKAIPVIKHDVLTALKKKGMYTMDPSSASGWVVGGAILIGLPFVLLDVAGVVDFFLSPIMAVISIAAAALIVILFGRHMSAKSIRGQRTKIAVQGFQEFMNRVDADRLKRLPPDTFEKYLPYAMALGVEQHWAAAFSGIVREPPSWYVAPGGYGPHGWNPVFFTSSMHSMSREMHSVMVSAPRSSSTGSGFSGGGGGGFSGGGFGGGGGSAF